MDISRQAIESMIGHCRLATLVASGVLLGFIAWCYAVRADGVAAITIYPPWCWAGLGVAIACVGLARRLRVPFAIVFACWVVFLIVNADSPLSLLRGWTTYERSPGTIRIVSLNCASSLAAAREVSQLQPDIVLFQESPSRHELEALAAELFGDGKHLAWGVDASIIASHEVAPIDVPTTHHGNFVHARVLLAGRPLDVISLRLYPCPVRLDLWSPRCWSVYRENREKRRREMEVIASYVANLIHSTPAIVGGDFNAPPGDAVFRLLAPRLSDAFPIAGRGWGGTIINEVPAIRIDQVWCSDGLRPVAAFARRTAHSDHRMVVVDLALPVEISAKE